MEQMGRLIDGLHFRYLDHDRLFWVNVVWNDLQV